MKQQVQAMIHTLYQRGSDFMRRQEQEQEYQVQEYHFENATVRVHVPVLTDEEREKRMKYLKEATADFLKSVIKQ